MKTSLLTLSLAAAAALPITTHAGTPDAKNDKTDKKSAQTQAAAPVKRQKIVYYMTNETRTGSAIPMVYRKYDGRIDSAANPAAYGQSQINTAGQVDVATALTMLDTSINVRR